MKTIWNYLPENAEVFLLSTQDEFLSEYVPDYNKRLEFISGFTGSYGFCILQKTEQSILFVDGRYTLQAKQEVNNNFIVKSLEELEEALMKLNQEIWLDGKNHSYKFISNLQKQGVKFCLVQNNPIDEIWKRKIINVSREAIFNFELAANSIEYKIQQVANYLTKENAEALFVFDVTDVSYIFNIRANHFPNSPTVPFFGIIKKDGSYELINIEDITNINGYKILIPNSVSYYIYTQLAKSNDVILDKENFITSLKIIKTESEIECIKNAHIEDAKALKEFGNFIASRETLENETEFTLGEKLIEFRKNQKGFMYESFPAIVGFQENGAIVHYRASKNTAKKISTEGILLVDSGGQYYNKDLNIAGTTDVTRTFYIGSKPTEKQKRIYTLALKGHLALAKAIFPYNTKGYELDVLTRQFLWQEGLNYNHSTGHGVGFFLSVHEAGGFSKATNIPLQAGMIVSNEPGCYLENEFGIRFESLMVVKNSEIEGFLCFEVLTKYGIESKLLDFEILTDLEIQLINLLYGKD